MPRQRPRVAPVPQHDRAIGQPLDLLQPMRDVDDAGAIGTQILKDREQPLCLHRAQARRGFVEDEQAGVHRQRARDRHELPLRLRQAPQRRSRRHRQSDACQLLVCVRLHPPAVEQAQRPAIELTPQEDVAGDVERVDELEHLMNHRDAETRRVGRLLDRGGNAIDVNRPRVRAVDAGQHLHQRRFAGPVLADQRDDLAAIDVEVNLGQSHHAGKSFGDCRHLQ